MSVDAATAPAPKLDELTALRRAQIFRLASGMTLSAAVAFGLAWPLSFITPVIAAKLLTLPRAITPKLGVGFLVVFGASLLFATQIVLPLLAYPAVHLLFTGLLLFLLFYAKAGGMQPVLVVLMIIAVLAIPLVGTVDQELAEAVAVGLFFNSAVAVGVVFVAAAAFPDPPGVGATNDARTPESPVPAPADRALLALRSLVVLYPLAVLLQLNSATGAVVALVMTIFLTLEPTYGKHLAAGQGLILANVAGGLVAVLLYQLLVFVPSYVFFLLIVLLAGLVIGRWVFSESVLGRLLGAGITTVFLVLGPSLTGDEQAGKSLLLRLAMIFAAVVYVVLAFGLLERLTQGRRRLA